MLLSLIAVRVASPDVSNLAGGVLIAHFPAAMSFSTDPPPEGWCQHYLTNHALESCEEQLNRIDATTAKTWFVLAAWTENKEWRGVDLGLGNYSAQDYVITDHGPCFPSQGLTIPTLNWPGPDEGVSLAVTDSAWAGNLLPVYYFCGYSYAPETVPLGVNPSTQVAAVANSLNPPTAYEFAALGTMGMQTDGVSVCPGGLVSFGDYLEVGIGVCCFREGCMPVAEPGCTALGEEWEYHPEYTSCDPNPCARMLTGDCTFPYRLHLADGAALRYITWDFETIYRPGDEVVVDWHDGQLTINGRPYLPHPEPAFGGPPPEVLQDLYGAVPTVQHIIEQQSVPDWNLACWTYRRMCRQLVITEQRRYARAVHGGMSPADAAHECATRVARSPLIDSALVDHVNPTTRRSLVKAYRHGMPTDVWLYLFKLAPKDPWLYPTGSYYSHRLACARLEALTPLETTADYKITMRYGNLRHGLED